MKSTDSGFLHLISEYQFRKECNREDITLPKGITSLTGFVKKLEVLKESTDEQLYFRGHNDKSFKLCPSVFRNQNHSWDEDRLLQHFEAETPETFVNDRTTFDRLVRSQHLGLPTRLLDVTSNPLVALFFACLGKYDTTGEVFVFGVPEGTEKFASSDTVSCLANLALLSAEERTELMEACLEIVTRKGSPDEARAKREQCIEELKKVPAIGRLTHFIKAEKPYFNSNIYFEDLLFIRAVLPRKNNSRILAQSGAFLLFGLMRDFHSAFAQEISVTRININPSSKLRILSALAAIGITENTLFPEPEKIAQNLSAKYGWIETSGN